MKIYVCETTIERMEKKEEVAIIYYSMPTQIPNCGNGTGNYGSGSREEKSYISFEVYDLIKNNNLTKVPTSFLDRLVWDKEGALNVLQDYIILNDIFNKTKKEKHL
jgi:hypothetical protein